MTLIKWMPVRNRFGFPAMRTYYWYDHDRDGEESTWTPNLNALETDQEYIIEVDLPGVSKKDIEINLKENVLTISGERKLNYSDSVKAHICEICSGKFRRQIRFNDEVDGSKITAKFKDGQLKISIPKTKPSVGREIKID